MRAALTEGWCGFDCARLVFLYKKKTRAPNVAALLFRLAECHFLQTEGSASQGTGPSRQFEHELKPQRNKRLRVKPPTPRFQFFLSSSHGRLDLVDSESCIFGTLSLTQELLESSGTDYPAAEGIAYISNPNRPPFNSSNNVAYPSSIQQFQPVWRRFLILPPCYFLFHSGLNNLQQ